MQATIEEKFKHGGGNIIPGAFLIDDEMHISRYAFASRFVMDKNVLDIACGVGYGSDYLVDNGAKLVVGGDISQDAIRYAKAHFYSKPNLNFIQLDCEKLPFFSNTFDVVISFETLEHLKDPKSFLFECMRVLKNNGIFIGSTPNKGRYVFPPKKPLCLAHVKEFHVKELCDLMKRFFSDINLFGQNPVTLTQRLLNSGARLVPFLPRGDKIRDLLTPVFFKEYKQAKHIQKEIFKEMIREKYKVLPLSEFPNSNSFSNTIVVANKRGD